MVEWEQEERECEQEQSIKNGWMVMKKNTKQIERRVNSKTTFYGISRTSKKMNEQAKLDLSWKFIQVFTILNIIRRIYKPKKCCSSLLEISLIKKKKNRVSWVFEADLAVRVLCELLEVTAIVRLSDQG